jgi:hypothetical protein
LLFCVMSVCGDCVRDNRFVSDIMKSWTDVTPDLKEI